MDLMLILRNLAIILVAAKLCGLLARKLKAPQVVGEIIAGQRIRPRSSHQIVGRIAGRIDQLPAQAAIQRVVAVTEAELIEGIVPAPAPVLDGHAIAGV